MVLALDSQGHGQSAVPRLGASLGLRLQARVTAVSLLLCVALCAAQGFV